MGKDPSELASYVLPLYQQFVNLCQAAGIPVFTEDTGRDLQQQQENIKLGRSWTLRSKHLPQSPEQKSEAFDVVPKALLLLKYWGWHGTIENSDPRWLQMGEIGEQLGLRWGGRWPVNPPHSRPDPGHFEFQHQSQTAHENVQAAAAGEN